MIRIILFSVLLFLFEVALFRHFSGTLLENFTAIDIKYLNFTSKQRRAIYNIQRIQRLKSINSPAIYVFGSSTAREFFLLDEQLDILTERRFINLGSANQTLLDSIRLLDTIEGSDVTIVYCMFPMVFMKPFDNVPADSRYLMGAFLKYPVASDYSNRLLARVKPRSKVTALIEELNVYCYLLKNYFLDLNMRFKRTILLGNSLSLKKLLVDEKLPTQHYYHSEPKNRKRLTIELLSRKKEIGAHLENNLKVTFTLFDKFVNLALQRDYKVKIIELPYSKTFSHLFKNEISIYNVYRDQFMLNWSGSRIEHIDLTNLELNEALFYDHGHLLDNGREFVSPIIHEFIF